MPGGAGRSLPAVVCVVVDLSDVTFLDCSALGVLVAFTRDCLAAARPPVLAAPSPIVDRLFVALGFHRDFLVTATVDEAVELGRQRAGVADTTAAAAGRWPALVALRADR